MLKPIAALTVSFALAFSALAPTPARADNEQIGRIILGAGLLAVLVTALNEQREEERRRENAREVQVQRNVVRIPPRASSAHRPPAPPARVVRPVPPQRGNPIEVSRILPRTCSREVRIASGSVSMLGESCLRNQGVNVAHLPDRCERLIDAPGTKNDRKAWKRDCLADFGYRIR